MDRSQQIARRKADPARLTPDRPTRVEALLETARGATSTLSKAGEEGLLTLCASLRDAFRGISRYSGCGAHHHGGLVLQRIEAVAVNARSGR